MPHDDAVPIGNRSSITVANLIKGKLPFTDKNISVKSIDIFLIGITEPIVSLVPKETEFGVEFEYIISARARNGEYTVVWNAVISGKDTRIFDKFIISDDTIDRTLPPELQFLT